MLDYTQEAKKRLELLDKKEAFRCLERRVDAIKELKEAQRMREKLVEHVQKIDLIALNLQMQVQLCEVELANQDTSFDLKSEIMNARLDTMRTIESRARRVKRVRREGSGVNLSLANGYASGSRSTGGSPISSPKSAGATTLGTALSSPSQYQAQGLALSAPSPAAVQNRIVDVRSIKNNYAYNLTSTTSTMPTN